MGSALYVVDTATLLTIQNERSDASECFDGMTDLVQESRLCFPAEVVEELGRLARGEQALVWAKAVAASRCNKGAPYSFTSWVLESCSGLVDETALATQEPAAPFVAAQAVQIRAEDNEVFVVTEDIREKPTRLCLRQACEQLDLPSMRLEEFLEDTNLP